MQTDILDKLISHLSINFRGDEEVLESIYERMLFIASDFTHRPQNDVKLFPYVEKSTIEAYLRRGKEGTTGYSEGSESESYIDIEEKLRKDILHIRRIP